MLVVTANKRSWSCPYFDHPRLLCINKQNGLCLLSEQTDNTLQHKEKKKKPESQLL